MTHRRSSAVVLAVVALWLRAQPAFEVASIKPADPNATGTGIRGTPGGITLENISLKYCVEQAFDVKDFSLSGPGWLDSARFDIVAKAPAAVPRKQINVMLQSLLVDRFKLAFHRESKVLPAYALVVDKGGLKVEPAPAGQAGWSGGRGMLDGLKLSMAGLADLLAEVINRPVKDMTGADGVYNIKLRWTPDGGTDAPGHAASPQPADPSLPSSVFIALKEQAGLRLESRKLPVDILVVDHIERQPTEN